MPQNEKTIFIVAGATDIHPEKSKNNGKIAATITEIMLNQNGAHKKEARHSSP